MSTVAVFTDLDRTLIYSARSSGRESVDGLECVETYRDAPASYVTPAAARDLRALDEVAVWVPTTTRTVAQYRRVRLPRGPRSGPDHALCANGGILLVDGHPDPAWAARVRAAVAGAAPGTEIGEALRRRGDALGPGALGEIRLAEDLFHYAVIDRGRITAAWLDDVAGWAEALGWRTSLQGSKLYCLPAGLSKAAAAAELARRVGATTVLAAGDSLLDADLLELADAGIHPRHGELGTAGWSAGHVAVTASSGIAAGEEIARWLRGAAEAGASSMEGHGRPWRGA